MLTKGCLGVIGSVILAIVALNLIAGGLTFLVRILSLLPIYVWVFVGVALLFWAARR